MIDTGKQLEDKLQNLRNEKMKGVIARVKAKWGAEGEKSTRYFCSLEKRNYTEKLIQRLILDDQTEASDLKIILEEQKKNYA